MKMQIINLLTKLNNIYDSKLITGNIDEYVKKISEKAVIITICNCGNLQGFIAYYDNDNKKETAYLTMIAIEPDNQGMGYGKNLLNLSINNLKYKGFKKYKLEVLKNNIKANVLYEELGFRIIQDNDDKIFMEKYL
jgi:ribosomal protein S18 acetylase RimI-like enzyme